MRSTTLPLDLSSHSRIDTGATPVGQPDPQPPARTVEYHRPTRNSAHYTSSTDMALGMASSNPSHPPRPPPSTGHAPSSFRSPTMPVHDFTTPSPLLPSRAAPPPPGPRRESSLGTVPTQASLASGSRQYQSKSATNSPNPNRYSAGAPGPGFPGQGFPGQAGAGVGGMTMTANGAGGNVSGLPPPRPSRAGTMPLDTNMLNGMGAGPLSPPTNRTPGGSPISHSHYLPPPGARRRRFRISHSRPRGTRTRRQGLKRGWRTRRLEGRPWGWGCRWR